jgi:D-alanyl-D-alanine endopeptidase (penicillin-binding protein 7)
VRAIVALTAALSIWAVTAPRGHAESAGSPDVQLDVRSEAAAVLDARTGAEIYGKGADEVRAIASTTKIFVAMAVRKAGLALEDYTEITREDVKAAKGGARTRLDVGQSFKNVDLLRAMLMASDNRAPTALARAAGMTTDELLEAMNAIAKDLDLVQTRFTDPSGLRGNVSTAREMALATRAVLADDVLREIMMTEVIEVRSKSNYAKLTYVNTNQALTARKYKVTGGKTGYTTAAGYCFITGAEIGGREVVMAFLGGDGKLTRFADFNRVAEWLETGASGAKIVYRASAPSTDPTAARKTVAVKAEGTIRKDAAKTATTEGRGTNKPAGKPAAAAGKPK